MDASHEWQPSGLVTWTTDFGLENGFVGTMRGVLLARAPQATWVDLTHGIPAQALDVAAIELRSALPYFAPGSLHVVVVDPGVGTERRVLCGVHGGQCVLGPDNGILPAVLGPGAGYFVLPEAPWTLSSPSRTFHGRDVFAPLAAALLTGELRPAEEEPCADPVRLDASSPVPEGSGRHSLRVQLVDRFGNLVTNWQVAENGVPAPGS
ncbi:MAG TPA: SAM-dependent chlorinase/fluorinase, partial [Planctomycetota bacterium]|nr:SAM-dependent chlorinase/fluorinase [Planctomycetota bacterium]